MHEEICRLRQPCAGHRNALRLLLPGETLPPAARPDWRRRTFRYPRTSPQCQHPRLRLTVPVQYPPPPARTARCHGLRAGRRHHPPAIPGAHRFPADRDQHQTPGSVLESDKGGVALRCQPICCSKIWPWHFLSIQTRDSEDVLPSMIVLHSVLSRPSIRLQQHPISRAREVPAAQPSRG